MTSPTVTAVKRNPCGMPIRDHETPCKTLCDICKGNYENRGMNMLRIKDKLTDTDLNELPKGSVIRPNEAGSWFLVALKLNQDTWTVTGYRNTVTNVELEKFADEWTVI